jgi:hypothetical protein
MQRDGRKVKHANFLMPQNTPAMQAVSLDSRQWKGLMRILIAHHKAEFAVLFLWWKQVSQGGKLKLDDTVLCLLAVHVLTLDVTPSKAFKSCLSPQLCKN